MTDLTPRQPLDDGDQRAAARRQLGRRRRTVVALVVVVLLVAGGLVAIAGLRNATLFFRNADEAIAQRDELGERRFRLQGRVVPASVASVGGVTTFDVVHECAVVSVSHTADPPALFESPWIPVVLEGRWVRGDIVTVAGRDSHYFSSDNMLVKHTNEYEAANSDRVPDEYEDADPDRTSDQSPVGSPVESPADSTGSSDDSAEFIGDCGFEVPRL